MKLFLLLRLYLSFWLFASPFSTHFDSQAASNFDITLQSLNGESPVQMQGLNSTVNLRVAIPLTYKVGSSSWLDISIQPSPFLDFERSSLTILVNDRQVTSIRPGPAEGSRLKVPIPLDMFRTGENSLVFTAMLYFPTDQDNQCTNWEDAARWLNLGPESLLHLEMQPSKAVYDLAAFPQVFLQPLDVYMSGPGGRQVLFVLPDVALKDDLTALVATAYVLGQNIPSSFDWEPEVVTESQFTSEAAGQSHVVLINALPDALNIAASTGKDYVALRNSPWNSHKAVLVIADRDRSDGSSPVEVFADPARKVSVRGELAYVDPVKPPAPPAFQNEYTLADLGYLDRSARGIGDSSLIYRLFLPYSVQLDAVKLFLSISHSPELAVGDSTINLYVNGVAVAGILPNARSAQQVPLEISIPAGRLRPGENFIRLNFDLRAQYSSCEKSPESVWVTVMNTSTLQFQSREAPRVPSLDHFPMPFSDYPNAVWVVPDHPTLQTLRSMAKLAFLFGQPAIQTNPGPSVVLASQFNPDRDARHNLILVGLPSENPALFAINNFLPQPFNPNGVGLREGYGIYIPSEQQEAGIGLVQILSSPWKTGMEILVITGLDQESQGWAWQALLKRDQWSTFQGNVMVAGTDQRAASGGSTTAFYHNAVNVSVIPWFGPFLQGMEPGNLIPSVVSILASMVLVLVVLFILNFRKR